MARRSARLQKRSPTPSNNSNASWGTAQSIQSPPLERLPYVVEGAEPVATMAAPKPAVEKPVAGKQTLASQLPQPASAATPLKSKPSTSLSTAFPSRTPKNRTPKNRTPIKPAGEEMHPALHHPSTAKPLDEARWLGFHALGAHTAPPKPTNGLGMGQATPSKAAPIPRLKMPSIPPSPEFRFRFKSPIADLSPKSRMILTESHKKEAVAGGRPLFGANEFSAPADVSPRKMAMPKSKTSRFSDVHTAEFKKMDSIANHPSAFRADPNHFKPVNKSLKRSPSKAELDKQGTATEVPNKLKRTQSKMDVTENKTKPPTTKLVATPLKRTQSKIVGNQHGSNLRSQSSVRLVPPSRDGRPPAQGGDSPAKRHKRTEGDDAASTRPASRGGPSNTGHAKATDRPIMGPPRFTSRLMTPTKSSLSRSQSVKAMKSTSMIPSLFRSPSAKAILSPTNISETMKDGMREGIRKTSSSLHKVRSILRTPSRKFSDDPEKVAAGTHMSPPPVLDFATAVSNAPATAPIRKHVNFTHSTLERAAHDELGKSPSPMKLRAGSEVPAGTVIYPTLQAVDYPALPEGEEFPVGSTSRRLTFGDATANNPTEFSFKSDKAINFGPASTSTIRMVRKSETSSLVDGKKRKLEAPEESSDKENNEPAENEGRSPKKAKMTAVEPPKTPSSVSKLPRRTPKRGASISKSRLAFLSTPKRSKA